MVVWQVRPHLARAWGVGSGAPVISVDGYGACVLIGRGGVGEVYRATRLSTGAIVAIKVLRQVSDQSAGWRRTRRELTAMVALAGHSNVIGVIEVLDLPGGPALVMEYAPGGSVGDLLAERTAPRGVGEAVLIAEHAARALVAAHAQGIVHRDIKPHNLLIDAYGQVKLCDFGIASLARSEEFRSQTQAVSLRYASPEDLEGDLDAGPSTDIYSLGATLLHLVHGAPPTLRERLVDWAPPYAHPDAHPGDDRVTAAVDDGIVAAVDAVIVACLRIDPARRPTAAAVVLMLEQLPLAPDDRPRSIAGALFACSVDQSTKPVHAVEIDEPPDRTIVRPSRSPAPAVPAAAEQERWSLGRLGKHRFLVALPLTASLGLAAALLGLRMTGGDVSNSSVAVEMVERPTDLVELTLVAWPLGAVGECLVQTAVSSELTAIDCSAPHDLQRIAAGQLGSGSEERAPDDATLVRTVNDSCTDTWEALVVDRAIVFSSVVHEALQLSNVRPTAVAVAAGDTTYQCFVGAPGQRMTGTILSTT
jgi:serine/threonine protein kinase